MIYSTLCTLMHGGHFSVRWNNAITSKNKSYYVCPVMMMMMMMAATMIMVMNVFI
jgi:hypothetical protein